VNEWDRQGLAAARRDGVETARTHRLPFGRQVWRGAAGGWQGAGAGSSIDFQDHRAYAPGDDPRHLHWAAYARTGQMTMKLYRAEVAPLVDLAVDASVSMRSDPARRARTESLVAFCLESAARAGAPVRLYAAAGRDLRVVSTEQARQRGWLAAAGLAAHDGEGRVGGPPVRMPWRAGAMKIWVSDLLFAATPAPVLQGMSAGGGCSLVLAPVLAGEAELVARGNVELVDPEAGSGEVGRRQRIDDALAERYRAAYARHFALWADAARRAAVGLARVESTGGLAAAFAPEARRRGVVEVTA
jgi:uncharacterized protein (DUF58 family)